MDTVVIVMLHKFYVIVNNKTHKHNNILSCLSLAIYEQNYTNEQLC